MGQEEETCRVREGGSCLVTWEDCWTCERCGTCWSDDGTVTCDK